LNTAPFISIGIPVFNGEKYLKIAIESVLQQNFLDFEIIISDNASTDDTELICKKYQNQDKRIRYIRQRKNIGGIANFNFVLEKSTGKYFMWHAADDVLEDKNFLSNIYGKISDKHDCYFTQVSIINENGKVISPNVMTSLGKCSTNFDFLKESININSFQFYGLYNRDILIKDIVYLNICKNLKCFNEGLFVHAISALRDIKYVSNAHKSYRKHNSNWSSSIPAKNLILSFIIYSFRSIMLFFTIKKITFLEKISIILLKTYVDMKYLIYLIIAAFFQYTRLNKLPFLDGLKKLLKKVIF
jgi:glycosyltransferase involved in cell wall biosynthesis